MPIGAAIGAASVVGAGATIYSANKASGAQTNAANQANQTEKDFYAQNKQELDPFIQGGTSAYSTLNNLLGVGGSGNASQMQDTLNNIPGYQFTLNQGLKSTQNAAAARGLADSGAALKGAATYATGLANSQYNSYVTNLQNSANTGEGAANALAGYGTTAGGQIASNQIGVGNANAAASNAVGSAVSNGANNLSQYYTLNSLLQNTNQAQNNGFQNISTDWRTS